MTAVVSERAPVERMLPPSPHRQKCRDGAIVKKERRPRRVAHQQRPALMLARPRDFGARDMRMDLPDAPDGDFDQQSSRQQRIDHERTQQQQVRMPRLEDAVVPAPDELFRYLAEASGFVGFEYESQTFVLSVHKGLPASARCDLSRDEFFRILDELPSDDDDESEAYVGPRAGRSPRARQQPPRHRERSLPTSSHKQFRALETDHDEAAALEDLLNFED